MQISAESSGESLNHCLPAVCKAAPCATHLGNQSNSHSLIGHRSCQKAPQKCSTNKPLRFRPDCPLDSLVTRLEVYMNSAYYSNIVLLPTLSLRMPSSTTSTTTFGPTRFDTAVNCTSFHLPTIQTRSCACGYQQLTIRRRTE